MMEASETPKSFYEEFRKTHPWFFKVGQRTLLDFEEAEEAA